DVAGNLSVYPIDGEFLRQNRRCETLRLSEFGTTWGPRVPWVDEWPVEPLGLPPLERLLAYRRIQVPATLVEDIVGRLREAGMEDTVQVVGMETPAVQMGSYLQDLRLMREGHLPMQRVDLLRQDIVNLVVPTYLLPVPESLPDQPEFRELREAIQFRLLHEKPR
ncbi:MAG TPA: hypothetical protein PKO06_23520, partial [Candidatus Ozemobacteraceae bacterium]|nr:hypothetical protein [Candidatus Ozemobacteraceae bacterium]